MTLAERREVTIQLSAVSPFLLKMLRDHPNQCSEYASNELIVRKVKNNG